MDQSGCTPPKLTYREAAKVIRKLSVLDSDLAKDLPRIVETFIALVRETGDPEPVSIGTISYHLQLHPQELVQTLKRHKEDFKVIGGYLVMTKLQFDRYEARQEENKVKDLRNVV